MKLLSFRNSIKIPHKHYVQTINICCMQISLDLYFMQRFSGKSLHTSTLGHRCQSHN